MSDRGWVADSGCDVINTEGVTSYIGCAVKYSGCDVIDTAVL